MRVDCRGLDGLNGRIRSCVKCRLSVTRTNAVPGEGDVDSGIMIVGQSPGRSEDVAGRPFVGRAGRFLDEMLDVAGVERRRVYITSVVKCHPPKNRNPRADEVLACSGYLREQVRIIKPRVVVLLGIYAVLAFLPDFSGRNMREIHGRIVERDGVFYVPMYHPACGMRFPEVRKMMREDFMSLFSYV